MFNIRMIEFMKFVFVNSVPASMRGAKGIDFVFLSSGLFKPKIEILVSKLGMIDIYMST